MSAWDLISSSIFTGMHLLPIWILIVLCDNIWHPKVGGVFFTCLSIIVLLLWPCLVNKGVSSDEAIPLEYRRLPTPLVLGRGFLYFKYLYTYTQISVHHHQFSLFANLIVSQYLFIVINMEGSERSWNNNSYFIWNLKVWKLLLGKINISRVCPKIVLYRCVSFRTKQLLRIDHAVGAQLLTVCSESTDDGAKLLAIFWVRSFFLSLYTIQCSTIPVIFFSGYSVAHVGYR